MNIYGEKVMLRAMERTDIEMLRETVNDPDIECMVGGWSFPLSSCAQEIWFQKAAADKNNIRFIIEIIETGEAIGMISLTGIDWKNRTAFQGIKLKSSAPKRKGYATDAVMTLEWYAFEELQLTRLDGNWVVYNTASKNLFEKCGMKAEGLRRRSVYKNGQYFDQEYSGILKEDYFEAKERLGWKSYYERRNRQ